MCRAQGEQWPYASTKYALANTKDEVLVKPKICPQIQKNKFSKQFGLKI